MTFKTGDPRAAEAGRKGQNIRWAKSTPGQRAEANRVMNAAKDAKYVEQASTTFERLGVAPTPEQVATAATALQRADLRERLAMGREVKASSRHPPLAVRRLERSRCEARRPVHRRAGG